MLQCTDKFPTAPIFHLLGIGQLLSVDVDYREIRLGQFFETLIRLCIDLLGDLQPIAPRFCEADNLFQPRSSGCLEVQSDVEFLYCSIDYRINGKFIAAGMYADLKTFGQGKFLGGKGNRRYILFKFVFELSEIADIIDTLKELTGKARGNCLEWNAFH